MGPSWPAASAVADPSGASNGVARVRLRARDGMTLTARHGTARLAARLQSIGSARMNPSHYVPHPTNDKERRTVNQQVCPNQTNGSTLRRRPRLRACSGDVSTVPTPTRAARAQAVRLCLFARLASPRLCHVRSSGPCPRRDRACLAAQLLALSRMVSELAAHHERASDAPSGAPASLLSSRDTRLTQVRAPARRRHRRARAAIGAQAQAGLAARWRGRARAGNARNVAGESRRGRGGPVSVGLCAQILAPLLSGNSRVWMLVR